MFPYNILLNIKSGITPVKSRDSATLFLFNCRRWDNNPKQGYLPLFLSDCLDMLDPVLTFDRLMGGIDLNKYLTDIPEYTTGRLRYNPVNMLKTVLFGFMISSYCSLRELEDNCKVNIRFMYLMDHQTPSYRTFGYFINEVLQDKIENIFNDINQAIFNEEHVDLQHIYIDGSKFEANANKYTWVWKKATEKFRYKLYEKITGEIEEINKEIAWTGLRHLREIKITINRRNAGFFMSNFIYFYVVRSCILSLYVI